MNRGQYSLAKEEADGLAISQEWITQHEPDVFYNTIHLQFQICRTTSSRLEVFCKKMFLEISQNSHENT